CLKFDVYKGKDNVEVANLATNMIEKYHPARVFLDVGGVGGGVYDILKDRGFGEVVKGINFGSKAINDERYANRRAEMWDKIREWLSDEVELPKDEGLFDELICAGKKYDFRGRLILEEKEEIKKRLGRSTDMADALALSFAEPVYDRGQIRLYGNGKVSIEEMFLSSNSKYGGW
ncbi:MAG TPA: hypothetical protein DIC64_00450, partial [Alphaproteobacteria bacterium]|nr:hypothetical protein [Alphaproteobacteria bacterium]